MCKVEISADNFNGPHEIIKFIFSNDDWQDAAEALIHLASALQEERGNYLKWLRPTLQSFVKAPGFSEACDSTHGRLECNSVKGSDQLLDSWRGRSWPLEGTIASSLTCQRCGYQVGLIFSTSKRWVVCLLMWLSNLSWRRIGKYLQIYLSMSFSFQPNSSLSTT